MASRSSANQPGLEGSAAPLSPVAAAICALMRGDAAPHLWRDWTPEHWEAFVAGSAGHGVAGLVRRALADRGWQELLPPAQWRALVAHAHAAVGHNLRAYKTLAEVLRLSPADAPLVVLKGAALGPSLYASPALRPLSDIDLLARPDTVAALREALERRGFRPPPALAPELVAPLEPHLTLSGGPAWAVNVELHWGLVGGPADWRTTPMAWFWEQTEPWNMPPALAGAVAAGQVRQFSPTAAMLYQAAHLVLRHGQDAARLIWLYDLHLLAAHPRLDWSDLCTQAEARGWGGVLRLALEQTARCFGTPLPQLYLGRLSRRLDPRISFNAPDIAPARPYDTWAALAQLTPLYRLRMLARLALPSPAYLRASYAPRWGRWWPLAYLYRWTMPLWRRRR